MNTDVYLERQASQIPAIELLQSMGYTYISRRTAKNSGAADTMFC